MAKIDRETLVAALVSVSLLGGCHPDPNLDRGSSGGGWDRRIWTDPETGCQYHFWQSGIGSSYVMTLAPRIGRDGKPMCGDAHAR